MDTHNASKPHESSELMFVEVEIYGHSPLSLIDLGAIHNFTSKDLAEKLGVIVDKRKKGLQKAVNSEIRPLHEVA